MENRPDIYIKLTVETPSQCDVSGPEQSTCDISQQTMINNVTFEIKYNEFEG
jgi:hypothetical protein